MASSPLSAQTVVTPKPTMLVGVADLTQPAGLKNGVVTLAALGTLLNSNAGVDISAALVTPTGGSSQMTLAAVAAASAANSTAASNAATALAVADAAAVKANNLSDLTSAAQARSNLGLAALAMLDVGPGLLSVSGTAAVSYGISANTALEGSTLGVANGVAGLDGDGYVPAASLGNAAYIAGQAPNSVAFTGGAISGVTIDNSAIGAASRGTGAFTALSSNGVTSLGVTSATSLDNTPIGTTTPASGAFTNISGNASAAKVTPTGYGSSISMQDQFANLQLLGGNLVSGSLAANQGYQNAAQNLFWQVWQTNAPLAGPSANDLSSFGPETITFWGFGPNSQVNNRVVAMGYGALAGCSFTASITGGVMTVTAITSGATQNAISTGVSIVGTGISTGTIITSQLTQGSGSTGNGGVGTYAISGTTTAAQGTYYLQGGDDVVAIGYGALNQNVGGGQDTAVGARALIKEPLHNSMIPIAPLFLYYCCMKGGVYS